MNSFYKNAGWLFSVVLGVLLHGSVHAITIYGKHLSDIITSDQVVTITFPENDDVVMLNMGKGSFDPKSGSIDAIDNLKEVFHRVISNKRGSLRTRVWNMSTNAMDDNSSHFVGTESINLQTNSLKLSDCLLESPDISIIGDKMNFSDCFIIEPKILNIVGSNPGSDYKIIQIIFRDQPKNPTCITGKIDLRDNQATQNLLLSNVKAIKVQFNPQAWNK